MLSACGWLAPCRCAFPASADGGLPPAARAQSRSFSSRAAGRRRYGRAAAVLQHCASARARVRLACSQSPRDARRAGHRRRRNARRPNGPPGSRSILSPSASPRLNKLGLADLAHPTAACVTHCGDVERRAARCADRRALFEEQLEQVRDQLRPRQQPQAAHARAPTRARANASAVAAHSGGVTRKRTMLRWDSANIARGPRDTSPRCRRRPPRNAGSRSRLRACRWRANQPASSRRLWTRRRAGDQPHRWLLSQPHAGDAGRPPPPAAAAWRRRRRPRSSLKSNVTRRRRQLRSERASSLSG